MLRKISERDINMNITTRANGISIKSKPFKVMVSLVTLVAFLCNMALPDTARAIEIPSLLSGAAPVPVKELRVDTFTLSEYLGHVSSSWQATDDSGLPVNRLASSPVQNRQTDKLTNRQTIIHIQDAHCNYAAQKRISDIIGYLNEEYGIDTVNLEGGAKGYDLSVFTDIADKAVRDKVSDHFVKEGLVNGAEYFAVNNPGKVRLWGIEDAKLYMENLKIYRDSLMHKEEVDRHLKTLSLILSNLKSKIYPKDLLDFDMKYGAYKAGNLEFKEYLNSLIDIAKGKAIDIKALPNIYLLNQTLEEEGGIDFKKANRERDELIDRIQKKLSRNALEEFVKKTVDFRSEKLSQKEFYSYLMAKFDESEILPAEFRELRKYISYISMYDAIGKDKIMGEIEALESKIRDALCRNDEERQLCALSKNLILLRKIFGITLTKSDYSYYKANEDAFDIRSFTAFIDRNAPLYGITAKLDNNAGNLDQYRRDIGRFYEYSFKRDDAFINNITFQNRQTGKPTNWQTILITGGFHTENLLELFKKQNISYISIMPNFKNYDGYSSPYFKILSGGSVDEVEQAISPYISAMQVPSHLAPIEGAVDAAGLKMFAVKVAIQRIMAEKSINGVSIVKDGKVLVKVGDPTDAEKNSVELDELLSMARAKPVPAAAPVAVPAEPGKSVSAPAALKVTDFGIASDNSVGVTRTQHVAFHEAGRFPDILSDIAATMGAKTRADGKFDLRETVRQAGGRITTVYGEVYITDDGILVVIDSRFQKDHAGRGEQAVYASTNAKAQHEIAELRLWKDFALQNGIATSEDIQSGLLGMKLREWMNDKSVGNAVLAERGRLIGERANEFHNRGLAVEVEYNKVLLGKLYVNKGVVDMLKVLIAGGLRKELSREALTKWIEGITVSSASYIYKNWETAGILYRGTLPNGNEIYILVRMENDKVKSVSINMDHIRGPMYAGAQYLQVPNALAESAAKALASKGIQVSAEIQATGFVVIKPFIESEDDKADFEKALDNYPIIKEFLLIMIERGIGPHLTQSYAVFRQAGGAHQWRGNIYKGTYTSHHISEMIHEYIHAVYDKLSEDQKREIELYFRQNHPELENIFKKRLYKGQDVNYATEGLAYYLQMALDGKRENAGFKTEDGKVFSLVLANEDLDFFEKLGLINEGMKNKIKYQLAEKQGDIAQQRIIAEALPEKVEQAAEVDFIVASEGPAAAPVIEVTPAPLDDFVKNSTVFKKIADALLKETAEKDKEFSLVINPGDITNSGADELTSKIVEGDYNGARGNRDANMGGLEIHTHPLSVCAIPSDGDINIMKTKKGVAHMILWNDVIVYVKNAENIDYDKYLSGDMIEQLQKNAVTKVFKIKRDSNGSIIDISDIAPEHWFSAMLGMDEEQAPLQSKNRLKDASERESNLIKGYTREELCKEFENITHEIKNAHINLSLTFRPYRSMVEANEALKQFIGGQENSRQLLSAAEKSMKPGVKNISDLQRITETLKILLVRRLVIVKKLKENNISIPTSEPVKDVATLIVIAQKEYNYFLKYEMALAQINNDLANNDVESALKIAREILAQQIPVYMYILGGGWQHVAFEPAAAPAILGDMPQIGADPSLEERLALAAYVDGKAKEAGVRKTLSAIKSSLTERSRDVELALGAALETKALGYVTPEDMNVVTQFVDLRKSSPANTATKEISSYLRKPAGKYNGANCESVIGKIGIEESESDAEEIIKTIDRTIDTMNSGKDPRAIFEVPSWMEDRFLAACRAKGLLKENTKGVSIMLNDPRMRVQILAQEGDPDVRTQFKFGISALEWVRREEKGIAREDADKALLDLIAFMVDGDLGPRDPGSILKDLLFKGVMKLRKIDWSIMDKDRKAWEAVAQAL
ncbi:MAG: hypothetical protein JXB40_05115 [Candidatus Omnitrophica bacterium]|nr:hypothetical protein [Candidatus Omnitrophota bacterium]